MNKENSKPIDILMIGSSIMKKWTNPNFINYPSYINLGVSRFKTDDIIKSNYLDLIEKFNPKYIIYYCGGNDIEKKIQVNNIIINIVKFIKFVYNNFNPDVKIIFISIIISPKKIKNQLESKINLLNKMIEKICLKINKSFRSNKLIYFEINDLLNDSDYTKDLNHLLSKAYDKINFRINTILF